MAPVLRYNSNIQQYSLMSSRPDDAAARASVPYRGKNFKPLAHRVAIAMLILGILAIIAVGIYIGVAVVNQGPEGEPGDGGQFSAHRDSVLDVRLWFLFTCDINRPFFSYIKLYMDLILWR